MLMNTPEYLSIIENIKSEIKAAQYRATIHANSDLLLLYYDIGTVINEYKTWGNKFIENLSYDIQVTFPERKGYSVRNLKYMAKFAARFADREIVQEVLAQLSWYHVVTLMDKVKERPVLLCLFGQPLSYECGWRGFLHKMYGNVIIPQAVFDEVTVKDDSACHTIKALDWINVRRIASQDDRRMYKAKLHAGEV